MEVKTSPEILQETPQKDSSMGGPLSEKLLDTVQEYLLALRYQDLSDAYQHLTSEAYRRKVSSEDFEEYLANTPVFTQNRVSYFNRLVVNKNKVVLRGTITSFDYRDHPVKFEMVQEDGQWKVNQFEALKEHDPIAEAEIILDEPLFEEAPKPFEIAQILIGSSVDKDGKITAPQTVIDNDVNLLFFNISIVNGIADTLVTLFLEHVESSSTAPSLSTTLQKDGDSMITFSYAAPKMGWPEGKYIVKITTSAGAELRADFEIKKQ